MDCIIAAKECLPAWLMKGNAPLAKVPWEKRGVESSVASTS